MSAHEEIAALLRAWEEVERVGDADTYRDLMTDDFRGIGPVGFVLDADQWAGRHRDGLVNHEFAFGEIRIRIDGDTACVDLLQTQSATAMGHRSDGTFRVGAVAVQRAGRWRLAQAQLSGPVLQPGERPAFVR